MVFSKLWLCDRGGVTVQLPEPACFVRGCVHFIGPVTIHNRITIVCDAFPQGIPREILDGEDLHLEPVEGDRGVQFEADPTAKFVWQQDELAELLATAE
jgi:hypothetical protein